MIAAFLALRVEPCGETGQHERRTDADCDPAPIRSDRAVRRDRFASRRDRHARHRRNPAIAALRQRFDEPRLAGIVAEQCAQLGDRTRQHLVVDFAPRPHRFDERFARADGSRRIEKTSQQTVRQRFQPHVAGGAQESAAFWLIPPVEKAVLACRARRVVHEANASRPGAKGEKKESTRSAREGLVTARAAPWAPVHEETLPCNPALRCSR